MKLKNSKRILRQAFHVVGADKVILTYIVFFIIIAILLVIFEPTINTIGDSVWYCFISATTTGFGDIAATTFIGRLLTIILSIYSLGVVAICTAVITSFFMENAKSKANESARKFIDDLEHLDELSKDELKEISNKVKKFNKS